MGGHQSRRGQTRCGNFDRVQKIFVPRNHSSAERQFEPERSAKAPPKRIADPNSPSDIAKADRNLWKSNSVKEITVNAPPMKGIPVKSMP